MTPRYFESALILSAIFMSAPCFRASAAEATDTAKILREVVVIESAAKAPVPLLPLDVRIVLN